MLKVMALALLAFPAIAQDTTVPSTYPGILAQRTSFIPITRPDGTKQWWFSTELPLPGGNADAVLMTLISGKMGEKNWCPSGWVVDARNVEAGKTVIVQGHCK